MKINSMTPQKLKQPTFGKVYISPFAECSENSRLRTNFEKSDFYNYLKELDDNKDIGDILVDSGRYASEGSFFETIRVMFLNHNYKSGHIGLNTPNFYRGFNMELDGYDDEVSERLTDYILSKDIVKDLSERVNERMLKIKENSDNIRNEIVKNLIARREKNKKV